MMPIAYNTIDLCFLIADKMMVRIRMQSLFLVDRRNIKCIGIERTIQNCSYEPTYRSHALLTSMDPLAHVDCRGEQHCNVFIHACPMLFYLATCLININTFIFQTTRI